MTEVHAAFFADELGVFTTVASNPVVCIGYEFYGRLSHMTDPRRLTVDTPRVLAY